MNLARRLARFTGIDRAVGFAVISRAWSAVAGIVTLSLLLRYLTPVQQGFYSAFGSLTALQIFFELGLSFVLLQFASHERAKLEWTTHGTLEGDPVAKARLSSLLRLSLLWYGVSAILIVVVVLPIGLAFFHKFEPAGTHVAWRLPWLWIALLVAGALATTPLYSVLEGCGLVAEIMATQMVSGILNSLAFWLMLCFHGGLFAVPVGGTVSLLWLIGWLWFQKRNFLFDLARSKPQASLNWRQEVWPFQWKIALSWLSGYFIFQMFVPVLFAFHGPIIAGQMGLSLSIRTSISVVALAWITTKSAPFGRLVAQRDWAQMDHLFFPCLWQSTIVLTVGSALFWVAIVYLHHIGHHLGSRFLAPLPLGLLLLATIINHIVSAEAIYLRAHKQEPFLILSLVGGVLVGLSSFFLGHWFGARGMMTGYLAVSAAIGFGFATPLFLRTRRQWHCAPSESLA